jgi:hypothetical protein
MVVYEAKCNKCHKRYIGSTKKFLHNRVHEHFIQRSSSIYKHNSECRDTWSFSIKARDRSLPNLRWLEAIIIRRDRPEINKKEEILDLGPLLVM